MQITTQSVPLILIRHAQSGQNIQQNQSNKKKAYSEYFKVTQYTEEDENLDYKYDPQYFDSQISENGHKQCEQLRKDVIEKLEVDVVIVSPFRRAIQTADALFSNHPSQPKLIVNHLFREQFLSSGDFCTNVEETMQLYKNFDFSILKQFPENQLKIWQLYNFYNQKLGDQLMQELKQKYNNDEEKINENGPNYIMNWFKNNASEKVQLEDNYFIKRRAADAKEFLKTFIKQYQLDNNNKIPKIVIVSHSRFLWFFRQKLELDETGWPTDKLPYIKNCEVANYDLEM